MVVNNLEFFDKNGYNLNLNWNVQKQIWEGNIFFPRVSVGLYENTTIYVVEKDTYSSDDTDGYTYPKGVGNIVFQWDLANTFVDEFFMFNFDDNYELKDTSSLIYTPYDGPLCETLIINRFDKYNVPLLEPEESEGRDDLLEVHVAFIANENSTETTYKRTLVLSYENGYTKYEIARITFFAETIEEDERLKVWSENLGYNLKPEDSIIFKQSDIHEYMPNFKLLNEKRKELMLEGHNIYPYIGGYKALLNAIKFFGYDNLNIIEFWKNINEYDDEYGKIYRTYVYSLKDRKTLCTKRKQISLDTKEFQKLNNISLVYNINHPEIDEYTAKYDEYGLPNVIEDFDKDKGDDFRLSIEESLVKLFALKKKLNNEFMPGSTKITDIVGEGHYFGINLIGNNPNISTVNYVEEKGYVDFSVFPNKHVYITENEDFARFIAEERGIYVDKTISEFGDKPIDKLFEDYDGSDSDSDVSINEIDKRSIGTIISGLMKEENNNICKYYEDYYNITYNKFGDGEKYGLRDIPEPRNIYKDIVLDDIPNDPYGENDVVPDMIACAKVVLKGEFDENVDITSIVEWKITHSDSGWSETRYGDVNIFANVFVQLPYLGNYDVEMSVWNLYNHCCKKIIKNAIIVEPYNIDIRGFYLDARPLPDNLKYNLLIPNEYVENIEEYNNTDLNDDSLYYVIKKNVDKMYNGAIQEHLGIDEENTSMRNYRRDGSVSHEGPYYKFDVDTILYRIERNYKEYEHLNEEIINLEVGEHYKYVRYINSIVDIKPLTWIVLGFDHSRITGRLVNNEYPKWTLTLIGDELDPDEDLQKDRVISKHNGLYFTYLFEDEGVYNIKLELMDINGNIYEIEKPIVIVDKDANYEMYHTLKDEYDKYLEEKNERNLIYI